MIEVKIYGGARYMVRPKRDVRNSMHFYAKGRICHITLEPLWESPTGKVHVMYAYDHGDPDGNFTNGSACGVDRFKKMFDFISQEEDHIPHNMVGRFELGQERYSKETEKEPKIRRSRHHS